LDAARGAEGAWRRRGRGRGAWATPRRRLQRQGEERRSGALALLLLARGSAAAADLAAAEEEPLAEGVGDGRIGVAERTTLPGERDERRRSTKKAREPRWCLGAQCFRSRSSSTLFKTPLPLFRLPFFFFCHRRTDRAHLSLSRLLFLSSPPRRERERNSTPALSSDLSKEQVSFSKGRASGKEKRIKKGNKKNQCLCRSPRCNHHPSPPPPRPPRLRPRCCGPGLSPGPADRSRSAPRSSAEK